VTVPNFENMKEAFFDVMDDFQAKDVPLDEKSLGFILDNTFEDIALFIICPDCNGNGVICTMDSTPSLNEHEQECLACQAFSGMVKVWPKEDS